jgi:hypothetical protein
MAVPYRDRTRALSGGSAGYLCVRDDGNGGGLLGALFVVNDLAEPLDFCFSRVDVPRSFLWRSGEARRLAARSLTMALFDAAPGAPDVIVSSPADVPVAVLVDDLDIDVPVCHLTRGLGSASEDDLHMVWLNGQPAEDAPAQRVLRSLIARKLALEPFERAVQGLHEVLPAP